MKHQKKEIKRVEMSNLIHSENRRRGWTLADLAKHLGISHVYMSSLTNGARPISGLSMERQRTLAQYLGMSLIDLLIECGSLREEDFMLNVPVVAGHMDLSF